MNQLQERNIVVVILLTILTCGIYGIYIFFVFNSEVQRQAQIEGVQTQPRGPGMALLLTIITCGIYGIVYQYFIAKALNEIGKKYNYDTMEPALVVVFTIFVGIGSYFNIYSGSELSKRIGLDA